MAILGRSMMQMGPAASGQILSPGQCRMARALLRWTQQDLAAKACVARRTVSDFECGARIPRPRTLRDIRNTFLGAGLIFDGNGIRASEPVFARTRSGDGAGTIASPVWPLGE